MDWKMKMSWLNALKDVAESLIEKPLRNMQRLVSWSSCPRGNSLTQRPKDSLLTNK